MTLSPLTSSSATLWAANLVASARLPSGVNTTCEISSPIAMVSITFTSVPLIDSTLIDLSARLATSARSPVGLKLSPDGCFAPVTVPASLGGLALRSITQILSLSTCLSASPSLIDGDRVRDQRDRAVGRDVEIDRRADHRVLQRQVGDGLRIHRIGEIDDQHRVLAGRRQDRLALVVPDQLLVVADDHERRRPDGAKAQREAESDRKCYDAGAYAHAILSSDLCRCGPSRTAGRIFAPGQRRRKLHGVDSALAWP